MDAKSIERALAAVGELLAADGEGYAIVVTGGATLNLLGIVDRATSEVDVIAQASRDETGMLHLRQAEPFPAPLDRAILTVARDLDLDEDWMNAVAGRQWSQGDARDWVLTQDAGERWPDLVEQAVKYAKRHR